MTDHEQAPAGRLSRLVEHFSRRKWRYLLGATAITTALTFSNGEAVDGLKERAPEIVTGLVVSEAAFVAGAAIAVGSVRKEATSALGVAKQIGNPLEAWDNLKDIGNDASARAANSLLFRGGLAVNTLGAVGTPGVIIWAAATQVPAEAAWPMVAVSVADMATTAGVRAAIWDSVRKNAEQQASDA